MTLAQAHLLTGSWVCLCPRLVAAVLNVAQKQYSLLKDANLLTPDMVSEFEELERLVHQEADVNLEQATSLNRPTEVSGATPAQRMQQGCDGEDLDLGQCCPLSFVLTCARGAGGGGGQLPATGPGQGDEFLLMWCPVGYAESGSSLALYSDSG